MVNFKSKEQFIKAIYDTLKEYKGVVFASEWLKDVKNAYEERYKKELDVS